MSISTVARSSLVSPGHWYLKDGTPFYEVPYADASKGMRPATLADARKVVALPSVTTILRTLNKPQLNEWLQEQAVLACMTSPRMPGEEVDQFIHRILNVEKIQDQESAAARERGSAIHDSIEKALKGEVYPAEYLTFVAPTLAWIKNHGKVVWSEKVLVGNGYAGRADALVDSGPALYLTDFKTCSTLPKSDSWPDHRIQTSMYAHALGNTNGKRIFTANVYISTKEPGQVVGFVQDNWQETFDRAARPLIQIWSWMNNYYC